MKDFFSWPWLLRGIAVLFAGCALWILYKAMQSAEPTFSWHAVMFLTLSALIVTILGSHLAYRIDTMNKAAQDSRHNLKQAQRELESQREVYRSLFEGVAIADLGGRIRSTNAAFRKVFSLQEEPASVDQKVIDIPGGLILQNMIEAVRLDGQPQDHEMTLPGPMEVRLMLRALPLSQAIGVALLAKDLTPSQRLADSRRDLVANVSHELRTPLTAIRGAAETLHAGALRDTEAAPRFVIGILEQSKRLEALLNDLLTLARLESSQTENRNSQKFDQDIDLLRCGSNALEMIRPLAQQRKIDLSLTSSSQVPLLRGNGEALERLLVNLLENAVKYNRIGGHVSLDIRQENHYCILEVQDDGIGIPSEDIERIFERFYRVDKGRARQEGGTGLGLAIVKHVAKLHDGTVEVKSRLGKGSTFQVKLPLPSFKQ